MPNSPRLSTFHPPVPFSTAPSVALAPRGKPLAVALFDGAAMGVYPSLARLFGYRFRVGNTPALAADAARVIAAAWGKSGIAPPPPDVADYGDRYAQAVDTWIVAYHRGEPVGSMALLDMRRASLSLELGNKRVPAQLDLDVTREIARLAIVPAHRGGSQMVMVGLLREMLAWSVENGVVTLFSGSRPPLFRVYERFNPTARLVVPDDNHASEEPRRARYFAALRAAGGASGVHFTFEVAGASPWNVFSRFLTGRLRRSAAR